MPFIYTNLDRHPPGEIIAIEFSVLVVLCCESVLICVYVDRLVVDVIMIRYTEPVNVATSLEPMVEPDSERTNTLNTEREGSGSNLAGSGDTATELMANRLETPVQRRQTMQQQQQQYTQHKHVMAENLALVESNGMLQIQLHG